MYRGLGAALLARLALGLPAAHAQMIEERLAGRRTPGAARAPGGDAERDSTLRTPGLGVFDPDTSDRLRRTGKDPT